MYLDKLVETLGVQPDQNYDKKVQCCGGALAFSEREKSNMIKGSSSRPDDNAADMM